MHRSFFSIIFYFITSDKFLFQNIYFMEIGNCFFSFIQLFSNFLTFTCKIIFPKDFT